MCGRWYDEVCIVWSIKSNASICPRNQGKQKTGSHIQQITSYRQRTTKLQTTIHQSTRNPLPRNWKHTANTTKYTKQTITNETIPYAHKDNNGTTTNTHGRLSNYIWILLTWLRCTETRVTQFSYIEEKKNKTKMVGRESGRITQVFGVQILVFVY